MTERPILATRTGELFQPVRIHYKVFNRSKLLKAFQKLRCLDHDPLQKRWVWLYAHEAKKLRFKTPYALIPEEYHPIVIGSFFTRTENSLILDLRSCERAFEAIPFFDKHLPRKLVEVTDAEIVNRFFTATKETMKLTPDALFDAGNTVVIDPAKVYREYMEMFASEPDRAAGAAKVIAEAESRARAPLPEIERFPTHIVADGIESFKQTIRYRQIVALKHWEGKTGYTMKDAIDESLKLPRKP